MLMDNNQFVLDRRQIIRRKVLAIGRMSRAYQVLKTNPELVRQLKSVSIDGKLPSGILSGGEQAMKEGRYCSLVGSLFLINDIMHL